MHLAQTVRPGEVKQALPAIPEAWAKLARGEARNTSQLVRLPKRMSWQALGKAGLPSRHIRELWRSLKSR